MGRRELSAADIYCKFAAQLDEDGFRLYHAAQQITGFQPYNAFPYPVQSPAGKFKPCQPILPEGAGANAKGSTQALL